MTKALLIKSYEEKTTGVLGQWNKLDQTSSYIQGIETGKILNDLSSDKLSILISGVPSPWARAKLFRFAFNTLATPDPAINEAGLLQFYKCLYAEWKGLIAVMALYPDRITISKPIKMDVNGPIYDITSAFGRMLFDESDLWSNQDELSTNADSQPFIQLIYFKRHLVGGTSPLTGVFTGVNYKLGNDAQDIRWYRNGKFEDPDKFLNPNELQKVYLFVKNINNNLTSFEQKVNSQRNDKPNVSLRGFMQMSTKWENDLLEIGNHKLDIIGPVANYGKLLSCPFNTLLSSAVPVYLKPDFTFTYVDKTGQYTKIDDIQSLMSDNGTIIGWKEQVDTRNSLNNAPVYFLKVKELNSNEISYFTVPLSEQAIKIFHNELSSMLGYRPKQGVNLTANFTPSGDLAVTMTILIDGNEVSLGVKEYKIKWQTKPQKVIMWPNFISDKWNRYYVYTQNSENTQPVFRPIYQYNNKIIYNQDGHFYTSDYNPEDGTSMPVNVKQLVSTPADAGDSLPKYNITLSDKPLFGLSSFVTIGTEETQAGYLIIRPDVVENLNGRPLNSYANIGFDFGSNNTCIYYKDNQSNTPLPVEFHNFRAMLVGQEIPNPNRVAEIDELLFFTNYESNDGQFKSWLHEHDPKCIQFMNMSEIAGGVPVNRPNVQVNKMTERYIETQAGILHYNMKWLNDSLGIQKKRAFIKSLWLQTCAFLFKKQVEPNAISWSYPGAMLPNDITELDKIFGSLASVTPIVNANISVRRPLTEAEAVCSYAISQPNFGLTTNNMFLGIDVGGSTSDILILAKDNQNEGITSLLKESSVRLAAGVFFNAVTGSRRFREAIVAFHGSKSTHVNVMNIDELMEPDNKAKAPYYLNCIFDQLKPDEYKTFYDSIDANAKFVFTIPAYVTGVLLFYSGMLIGKVIKEKGLQGSLNHIDVLPFGKGGRLFHWLYSAAGTNATEDYYNRCLNSGLNTIIDCQIEVQLRRDLEKNNKTEVARGLCIAQNSHVADGVGQTDICGEKGVKFRGQDGVLTDLSIDQELDGSFFKELSRFDFDKGECFYQFMKLFTDFVCKTTKLYENDPDALMLDIRDVPGRIINFIKYDDPEYDKALSANANEFAYHQPIFIVEAASYLRTLVDKIFAY